MDIEFEAKFININKTKLRKKLANLRAKLVKPELLYKRTVFFLPKGHEIEGGYIRVRDEGDKVTMSLKATINGAINTQKEVMVVVDNYSKACLMLTELGCIEKAYQESKRESWELNGVEITIDEWPYLEPYVEIEAKSEDAVKNISRLLGFNYRQAIFGATDQLISKKYGIPEDVVNNKIRRIVFGKDNPYTNWLEKNKRIS